MVLHLERLTLVSACDVALSSFELPCKDIFEKEDEDYLNPSLRHICLYGDELRIDVNSSPNIFHFYEPIVEYNLPSSPFRDQSLVV